MRCNGEIQKVPGFENYHQCTQNVPLFRRGSLPPEELMTWKSDTWIEVADGDAVMTMHGDVALAKARLRHDAFDYVAFDGELFDVERFFVFVPDKLFLVVDRLIAITDAEVTAGQIWHSTATVSVNGENAIGFSRDGRTFMARFAQSRPMRWNISEHDNQDNDPFYFPNPVRDMLCHGVLHVRKGDVISFAAAFGRSVDEVKLKQDASRTGVSCGKIKLSIDSFDHAKIKFG